MTEKTNNQLIKQLIADTSDDKIGMRMRAVVDAVVSAAVYAYVAGLLTAEAIEKLVRWYETCWVKQQPSKGIQMPLLANPVCAPVVIEEPKVIETLEVSPLAPMKTKRRRAVGFAN